MPQTRGIGQPRGRAGRPTAAWHATGLSIALALAALMLAPCGTAWAFDFSDVVKKAEATARQPYEAPKADLPKALQDLNYDQYREIRFHPEQSLWRREGLPFELQFFHRGFYYTRKVSINIIEPSGVKALAFEPGQFSYGAGLQGASLPADLGYAGFRVHYPMNRAGYKDEVIAFLGASYFRAIGKGQGYGLSARGLALDTAESTGEEFPVFREYWIQRPARGARELLIYALLDSPSAAGAYELTVRPGETTVIGVRSSLFLRKKVAKFGISPLTSMFFYGENTVRDMLPKRNADFRPEVHDSDGLLIHAGNGEWIWRPLLDPGRLMVNSFQSPHVRGFGLMQRDRAFDHYQDLEAYFERRTSAWVTPRGDWGEGRVELVQIPSDDERNDNVVAYWIPAKPPEPGRPVQLAYDLNWLSKDATYPPGGRVDATRTYVSADGRTRWFVLDFKGPGLPRPGAGSAPEGVITVDGAGVSGQRVESNPEIHGWRLSFPIPAKAQAPRELRVFLKHGQDVLTETWSYAVEP
jgi:periplasmic glucans biosynthesis protein